MAVIDIRMPPTFTDEGLRAAIALRQRYPGLGILLFSQYIETRYAAELLARRRGGIGYLLKDRVADMSEFVEALVRVASGGTALDPEVVTQLVGRAPRGGTHSPGSARGAGGAVAHGGGPLQRRDRDGARRSPRGRSRSTSPTSSPSSTCRCPKRTTGVCWRCCGSSTRRTRQG